VGFDFPHSNPGWKASQKRRWVRDLTSTDNFDDSSPLILKLPSKIIKLNRELSVKYDVAKTALRFL